MDVRFATPDGDVAAVRRAFWQVNPGQTLGLVGESGSGKTASGLAVLGLHTLGAAVRRSIRFTGEELLGAGVPRLRRLRGSGISMTFQDAQESLNPFRTVGAQIAEAYRLHQWRAGPPHASGPWRCWSG